MGGGLFPGKPFAFNLKCIVFTAAMAGGYWFLPPRNKWIGTALLWLPYVSMAYYDYAYDCANKMAPTPYLPFGRWLFLPFKPAGYQAAYKALSAEEQAVFDKVDHVAGWTLVVIAGAAAAAFAARRP